MIDMRVYKSEVVCRVCGISARMLGYWIARGLVAPTKFLETERRKRRVFLFTFQDLVRVRVVSSLRESGLSLQSIRRAVDQLRCPAEGSNAWDSTVLVTNGKDLFRCTDDPRWFTSLNKGERGQFVFAVVGLGSAYQGVASSLRADDAIDTKFWKADVKKWCDVPSRARAAGDR